MQFSITFLVMAFATLFSSTTALVIPTRVKRANTPSGYTLVFQDQFAVLPATDLISQSQYMASFDPTVCATTCSANPSCNFFDIFVTNSPASGVYCTYYTSAHTAKEATVSQAPGGINGQGVHQSYGFAKKVVALYSSSSSIVYSSMTTKALTSGAAATPVSANAAGGTVSSVKTVSTATSLQTSAAAAPVTTASCGLVSPLWADWCGSDFETGVKAAVEEKLASVKTNSFILPLYLYPAFWTSPGTWDWVTSAIKTHSDVDFTIIINPSDGPGVGSTGAPNADYATGIAALRSAGKNVKILGYVDTMFGTRAKNDVLADIKVYASWSKSKLDGIYFDAQSAATSKYSLYSAYAKAVRSNTGFGKSPIVASNPAGSCDQKYITLFDFVVVYADTANNLESSVLGEYDDWLKALSSTQLAKLAWYVSDATTASAKAAIVNLQAGVEAGMFYVSDKDMSLAAMDQVATPVLNVALKAIATPSLS